ANAIMQVLGIDSAKVLAALQSGLGTDFSLSAQEITGTAWLAGDNDECPEQARFAFDARRLVTVRTGGDSAFAEVQNQLGTRAGLVINQPSRLLGFVLQAMQTTLQKTLTEMSVQVSLLDMEIITTTNPSSLQTAQLVGYRRSFQPFAMRFPAYVINVNGALVDPDTITVIDQAGVKELQSFATLALSTEDMIDNLVDAIKAAVQDLQGQVVSWQGVRINQLTVVTIIFLPITFLTGYFGMNFQWIENLIEGKTAFFALGVALPILLLAISAQWLARRGFRLRVTRHPKSPAKPTTST
ncbi:MAG: hypothetical protein KGR25_08770, partial [Chloroflexi bacterium]|nr:hypothetical protein [Chloroflexota bacterium]